MSDAHGNLGELLEELFRREWGRLCATAARMVGDLELAEEIVQETLATALERWPFTGVPERPGAWLMTATRNRALDHLRRAGRRKRREQNRIEPEGTPDEAHEACGDETSGDEASEAFPDDRLRLIFVCCHPELSREAQVALTLRLLGGLSTREIAHAFLIPEPTVAQRIVRAKRTIAGRRIPYRVPPPAELPARLPAVLDVLYLVYNEGYAAREGESLLRVDLCEEALRLASAVAELLPDEPEALGLLALMEFQSARAATRVDVDGNLVLLEDQDRSRWDRLRIERARRHLARALEPGRPGPYALQAAIAERHALAASWDATDWQRISALYEELAKLTQSPVVELNRAVAIGMLEGAEAALRRLDALASSAKLESYHLLPAARADFLRRLGRAREAAQEYRRALALVSNARERAYLERRLAECERG